MIVGAVLGVTILLIGIAVSPTTAHRADTFDYITCKDLRLVDEYGNVVVWLYAKSGGGIEIHNKKSIVAAITGTIVEPLTAPRSGGNISLYSSPTSGPSQAHWNPEEFHLLNTLEDHLYANSSISLSTNPVGSASVSVSYTTDNLETGADVWMYAGKNRESHLSISNKHGRRVIKK